MSNYNYYTNYSNIGNFRMCVHAEQEPVMHSDAYFRKYAGSGSYGTVLQQIALARELVKANRSESLAAKILSDTENENLSRKQLRVVLYWVKEVIDNTRYNFLSVEHVNEIYKKNK